ncbi:MAG: HAMP domain-containing histidine kinase [Endomicrobiales bacterium]|nr:HAMP domain-containing histidine kinase [Endomicrobiales bacterium]
MSIKARLVITFSLFIFLVLFMWATLLVFGVKNRKVSQKIFETHSNLYFLKEIYQDYNVQWLNLKGYLKSKDKWQLNKFWGQSEVLSKKIENTSSDIPALQLWFKEYSKFESEIRENLGKPIKAGFSSTFNRNLDFMDKNFRSKLNKIIYDTTDEISVLNKQIEHINALSIISSIVIGITAILISMLIGFIIFRSITHPLTVFQQGTRIIGEGNLDYQIDIKSKDEIGHLADSFNNMVNNLRNLQLQIVQMDRMSSIGQLAGGVAHEINNPLTGVLGQAQLMLERLPKEDPHRRTIERIESAAQRCRSIVRALLDFAREKNYRFQPTDVNELINETLEFTKSEMHSKRIQIDKDIPDVLPDIQASSGHLQQVFLNLINNAIHAMPKGGRLSIIVSITEQNIMEITFADTGIGIKKENVGHVFDPFFTTKEVGKGTGLGLTISYGIIKRHKGEIVVRSEGENNGAAFTIRLPISQEMPSEKDKVTQLYSPPLTDYRFIPGKEK